MTTVKLNKTSGKKGAPGDIIAVPFKRNMFGFIQVLEVGRQRNATVGLLPKISAELMDASLFAKANIISQSRIELTGLPWKHWQIIGRLPLLTSPRWDETSSTSPCFVAEVDFVARLKTSGVIPSKFRLYKDIAAYHPKLRPLFIQQFSIAMGFLKEHKLLSPEGVAEIATGKVPPDFSLTSDLLTSTGVRFYERVFKKDFVRAYFLTDTQRKLNAEWEAFKAA